MVDFQYKQQTRPPEYLLLIDRHHGDNHRARLFDWMYQQFKAQEVIIERFFFDGDPRLCKNENHPNGIRLNALQYQYPNARLLILSQGNQMIKKRSGKLAPWIQSLEHWRQRAILSPKPIKEWGLRERQLLTSFEVLPATAEGLSFLVDHFDKFTDRARPDQWRSELGDTQEHALPINEKEALVPQLQAYFPSDLVKWIGACAVYPAIHWDLTLFLGDLVGRQTPQGTLTEKVTRGNPQNNTLLTTDNINLLNQLPWFVAGKIPMEARSQLVDWLETAHPTFLKQVREELHTLFQKQNIPVGSVAYQEFQMNVALNEYAFTRNRKKKKELEAEIAHKIEAGIDGDFTVIKELEGEPGPLDLVIPAALRIYAYRGSYKGLGLKRSIRDILWGSVLFLSLIGAIWGLLREKVNPCNGNEVPYENMVLCLENAADSLLYFEHLTRDSLAEGAIDFAKDLVAQSILLGAPGQPRRTLQCPGFELVQLPGEYWEYMA